MINIIIIGDKYPPKYVKAHALYIAYLYWTIKKNDKSYISCLCGYKSYNVWLKGYILEAAKIISLLEQLGSNQNSLSANSSPDFFIHTPEFRLKFFITHST